MVDAHQASAGVLRAVRPGEVAALLDALRQAQTAVRWPCTTAEIARRALHNGTTETTTGP